VAILLSILINKFKSYPRQVSLYEHKFYNAFKAAGEQALYCQNGFPFKFRMCVTP